MRTAGFLFVAVTFLTPTVASAAGLDEILSAPLRMAQRWEELSPEQQERAYRNYKQYRELPPEKKRDINRRYEKWKNLPTADKDKYRKKYDDYRGRGLLDD
jgi:hypothetical protein